MSDCPPTPPSAAFGRLESTAAPIDTDARSADRLPAEDNAVQLLPQFGLVRVAGSDAVSFLQSQLTSDLRELRAGCAQLSSYCTPQGRAVATLLLWRDESDVIAMLPRELRAELVQRLSRYILRANVRIGPEEALVLIGLTGANALTSVDGLDRRDLPHEMAARRLAHGWCVVLRSSLAVLTLSRTHAGETWDALAARLRPSAPERWNLECIRAGIPIVTAATQDEFVPQMLNLERLGAVGFDKGCYPGQEVIARAQYRGEVKRRLFRVALDAGSACAGQDIFGDGVAGKVVNAASTPAGGAEMLAVLRLDALQGPALRLGAPNGPSLRVVT